MTRLAGVAGVESGAVLAALAARVRAVVATDAVVDDVGVIDGGRQPRGRRVTQSAVFGGRDVIDLLARGDDAIVTRGSARDAQIRLRVIHLYVGFAPRGQPGAGA